MYQSVHYLKCIYCNIKLFKVGHSSTLCGSVNELVEVHLILLNCRELLINLEKL